jgi:SAM-dependent methyltransferase
MAFWDTYHNERFTFDRFDTGARVLDVGFGDGDQMRSLVKKGCDVWGVDYSQDSVNTARATGLQVSQGVAESLPFPAAHFDGVICKVVVPYTDESRAVAEWARVLKPNGVALVSYHGAGYYLRYVLKGEDWKGRVYGSRSIVNSWVYRMSGQRLPGFMGDTIYQSEARLQRYYARGRLLLEDRMLGPTYAGFPVFIYHTLRRAS